MFKTVKTWPDKSLRKVCKPIGSFDDDLKQTIVDMVDTCNIMFGVGLAAPQIGLDKRIVVIKPGEFKIDNPFPCSYNKDFMVLINPILNKSDDQIEWQEACLSLPGVKGFVKRSSQCKVTFLDENGKTQTLNAEWPLSGGIQHEVDHLDGIVYSSRMDKRKRRGLIWKLQRERRKENIRNRNIKFL